MECRRAMMELSDVPITSGASRVCSEMVAMYAPSHSKDSPNSMADALAFCMAMPISSGPEAEASPRYANTSTTRWALISMVLVAAVISSAASSNSMAEIFAYCVVATRRRSTSSSGRPCRQNSTAAVAISVADTLIFFASARYCWPSLLTSACDLPVTMRISFYLS